MLLKLATLAPEGSAWMRTFHQINQELASETGGALTMRAYPGGVMGDDHAVLRKMRIGQIHIAGLTGLGLGLIFEDTQIVGTPFLFSNYREVDHVMNRITERMEEGFLTRGFVLIGWSEIGFIYMMSNKPIARLEDFQNAKVWIPEGDLMSQAVFRKAHVSPVPLTVPDVLLALQTGLVDVVYNSPTAAIALQWFTKIKYITRVPLGYSTGGVVITRKTFQNLLEKHQSTLTEIFRKSLVMLNAQTRKDNEEALRIMTQEGIQSVDLPSEELARFQEIARDAREEMAGKVFSADLLQQVMTHLDEVRGE
jgi:TRAP-type C4-dicarboxylate transport system substrate-binding protein